MSEPTRLPIATQFCAESVSVGNGLALFVDGNSKITKANGTYAAPRPNAFSLPASSVSPDACPGSTSVCRASCYVRGLAKAQPALYAHYEENQRALDVILSSPRVWRDAAAALGTWIKVYASDGFRWHVSGDVQNNLHALWIADVCHHSKDVPHWIYTRTLSAVKLLTRAPNLTVNMSADAENYAAASAEARRYGVRLCYEATPSDHENDPLAHRWTEFHENAPYVCSVCGAYAEDRTNQPYGPCPRVPASLPPGSVIFPDYALRGRELAEPATAPWWQSLSHEQRAMVCPADFFGQTEAHRCGPCKKCL